ncbi:MAG: GNAT family N-acetyltransferase [Oscillospiraceae bacterium]|nr:GNAT family N-acetyltransferase [Oscillospiraceae bacterium]
MLYNIRLARQEDGGTVMDLYRSLIGAPGCTWNPYYPTIEIVREDAETQSLYCMFDESGGLAAAASARANNEFDELGCWNKGGGNLCDLSRLAVRKDLHRQGLAEKLVKFVLADVKRRGFDGVRLLAGKENRAALALYNKLGFKICGEAFAYGLDWYCCELRL